MKIFVVIEYTMCTRYRYITQVFFTFRVHLTPMLLKRRTSWNVLPSLIVKNISKNLEEVKKKNVKKKILFIYFIRFKTIKNMNQIHINDKVGQQKKQLGHLYIMNRNFKQWRSIVPPISTIWTIASHLNSVNTKKTIMYDIGNTGPSLGQAQKCGGIKWVSEIPTLLS